jgi:replicative DNA helicase
MANLKLPPQNLEAEESVLGSLMMDKDAVIKVVDILLPDDFYTPSHGKIYGEILNLFQKHQPVDLLSVTSRLKEANLLKSVGGSSYITKLIDGVPTASNVGHYAKIVKEKKILRDLIRVAGDISETAFTTTEDVDEVLGDIEKKVFAVSQKSVANKFSIIKDELKSAYERIEKLHRGEGRLRGVGTGFTGIDNYLSGLQKSDLVILGARPSVGKTTFALDVARHAAIKEGKSVGIFSLEMSREQVIDRLISAEARVPLWKLRTGRLSDDTEFELIQASLDTLSKVPIFVDDTPSPNMLQMRSMARRLQAEHGLDLILVDYLQLIQPKSSSFNLVQQITEISRELKGLARELDVPVLSLAQLSRSVDHREVKIPRLSDLRDSGSIEQDADVVMFIYRPDRDKQNPEPEEKNTTEIIIAKHRNGPLGTVKLKFDPDQVTFQNIDTVHVSSTN